MKLFRADVKLNKTLYNEYQLVYHNLSSFYYLLCNS
jgi:hypothetical protein